MVLPELPYNSNSGEWSRRCFPASLMTVYSSYRQLPSSLALVALNLCPFLPKCPKVPVKRFRYQPMAMLKALQKSEHGRRNPLVPQF